MSHYNYHDFNLSIPDEWVNRTIVAFAAPPDTNRRIAPNIVISQDLVKENESVKDYADQQLVEFAKTLKNFKLQNRQEIVLNALPAIELLFEWDNNNTLLQQQQIFVVTKRPVVLSIVTTALKSEFSEMEPVFNSIIQSVKFS
jgi:hypothetical protein